MSKTIKVSVLCLAYNQADYIKEALDGFLKQQTNFDFEVLINDDASDDGTQGILKEYEKKHPDLIKVVYQKSNRYSTGKRNFIGRYLLPRAKGEYVALCEGDDYWTDPHKLQKQVDFLDANPEYSLCFHPVQVVYEEGDHTTEVFPVMTSGFTVQRLLQGNFIQTNSVMYRRQDYKSMKFDAIPADWYLHLYHAQFGKIGFINEPMAVYRRHSGGIWWSSMSNLNEFWLRYGVGHIKLYVELLQIFKRPVEQAIIKNNIDVASKEISAAAQRLRDNLANSENNLQHTQDELKRARKALDMIIGSRTWKLRSRALKLMGRHG